MGFINGLVHRCNIVRKEFKVKPNTRNSKKMPGDVTPKTIGNRSSQASHVSRRHSDSSTSSSESLDQSTRSSLDSRSEHVTAKSSLKSMKVPLSVLYDSQSDKVSTSHRSLDGFDSPSEYHVTSKALENEKASRSGLDSQSEHISTSHPVPRSRHFITPHWLSKHGSHRRLDGLVDTRSGNVPRNCHVKPRWLSKHTNHRRLDGIDTRRPGLVPRHLAPKSVCCSSCRLDGIDTRPEHGKSVCCISSCTRVLEQEKLNPEVAKPYEL
jgi:hypothetical protein